MLQYRNAKLMLTYIKTARIEQVTFHLKVMVAKPV